MNTTIDCFSRQNIPGHPFVITFLICFMAYLVGKALKTQRHYDIKPKFADGITALALSLGFLTIFFGGITSIPEDTANKKDEALTQLFQSGFESKPGEIVGTTVLYLPKRLDTPVEIAGKAIEFNEPEGRISITLTRDDIAKLKEYLHTDRPQFLASSKIAQAFAATH